MRNVYISFLGTSPYLTCTYWHSDHGKVENVRYVQEATLSMICRDWTANDRIFIFTTESAYEKNWLDGGNGKDPKTESGEGLKTRIENLALNAPVERVPIADMTSETEMWEIFQKMFDVLEPEDAVVFDITHAFRSIPMLAIVVLNYARVLKKVRLDGIYYGAFEVLGHPAVAKDIPVEKRLAPVLDLTGFNTLLEWSAAIDGFLKSGDAVLLRNLAHQSLRPLLRDHEEMRDAGNALKRLTNNLEEFGKILSTCRGQRIVETTQKIQHNIDQCAGADLIPAFRPLLAHIRPRMEGFRGDEIRDGVAAARWCLEHNLVQQGFTILQETLITHLLQRAGVDPMNKVHRTIVNSAVKIIMTDKPFDEWYENTRENEHLTRQIMAILEAADLVKLMANITQDRNDLNHAGYNEGPRPPAGFTDSLGEYLEAVYAYLDHRFDQLHAEEPK